MLIPSREKVSLVGLINLGSISASIEIPMLF